jgi:AAA+ superfamily predicted ATPase
MEDAMGHEEAKQQGRVLWRYLRRADFEGQGS